MNDLSEIKASAVHWLDVVRAVDWDACARVFRSNGWTYGGTIPGAVELRENAEYLFTVALTHDHVATASGRMVAAFEDGEPVLYCEAVDAERYARGRARHLPESF